MADLEQAGQGQKPKSRPRERATVKESLPVGRTIQIEVARSNSEPIKSLQVDVPESLHDSLKLAAVKFQMAKHPRYGMMKEIVIDAVQQWLERNGAEIFDRAAA